MNPNLWTAVDSYVCDLLVAPNPALDAALADTTAAGLPAISVTPNQGKLLALLVQLCSARTVLEIGTLAATARSGWRGRWRQVGGWSRLRRRPPR